MKHTKAFVEKPYFTLERWLRQRHGGRVQKIPLDAASTCPNRDGTLSQHGCTFCNDIGSGSGLALAGLDLPGQWQHWREHYAASPRNKNTRLFLAYLQSFSNTYGSAQRLEGLLDQLDQMPGLVGLCVGTRPDCLDEKKMALLAAHPWPELWLELGAQSCHDATLARINRGHSAAATEKAVAMAHRHGLRVCLHLMAALPGEGPEHFLQSLEWATSLGVAGVKLHCLYICKDTALAREYEQGEYTAMDMDQYAGLIARGLAQLPSNMVIHRLTADPGADELLAPAWARLKGDVIRRIEADMFQQGLWQGCRNDAKSENPFQI